MKGKLYGVGIGPGDPGLITIRAKDLIETTKNIIVPVKNVGESSTALDIVKKAIDLSGKNIIPLKFEMDGGKDNFVKCGISAGDEIVKTLSEGEDAVMITLGDVSIYSTYMYLNDHIRKLGFETEIIPGVPSFSHAAALSGTPLVLNNESLIIMPGTSGIAEIKKAIEGNGNVVIMKSGGYMKDIIRIMKENNIPLEKAKVVSRAGMDGQYIGSLDPNRDFNYFTTTIIRKGE